MLQITIPAKEFWDEEKEEFVISGKEQTLQLEHSLVSISKWESKYCKPFLSKESKTNAETIEYIKCMTITQNINPDVYDRLTNSNIEEIENYIENPMSATTFHNITNQSGSGEQVTSELIYFWMVSYNIPMECQKWHINRLLALIRICNIKNAPPKKMSRRETASQYAALNAARRRKYNTKG